MSFRFLEEFVTNAQHCDINSRILEPLKNMFSPESAARIAKAVKRAHKGFDSQRFLRNLDRDFAPLELKQRVALLAERLARGLPDVPARSISILVDALRQGEADFTGLSGFDVWPLTHFVMERGLGCYDVSMKALYRMTQVFTAEFAIRPYLIHDLGRALSYLNTWVGDPDEHVRRLVSEGTRPLLPWGQRLPDFVKSPETTWYLLDKLKTDPAKYVQKSVANHINDHSKNHGDWVVDKLSSWKTGATPSVEWIVRHATRTLVKQGHLGALRLHGLRAVKLDKLACKVLTPKVKLGGALQVRVSFRNPSARSVDILVDHEILFLKANGEHAPKVFKGLKTKIEPRQSAELELKVPIRKVTTRKYHFGKQGWRALINGVKTEPIWFHLSR